MTKQTFGDERDWFCDHPLGLFVHWGPYALPGWHEQIQQRMGISREDYARQIAKFNPVDFDPEPWLDLMQQGWSEPVSQGGRRVRSARLQQTPTRTCRCCGRAWQGGAGRSSKVHQWGMSQVDALQLQTSIATLMREMAPRLDDFFFF